MVVSLLREASLVAGHMLFSDRPELQRLTPARLHATLWNWWIGATLLARLFLKRTPRLRAGSHVVIVASDFPPAVTGGVYRVLAIVNALAAEGWTVTVVTRAADNVAATSPGGVLLHRVASGVGTVRVAGPSADDPWWQVAPMIDRMTSRHVDAVRSALVAIDARTPVSAVLASGPKFGEFVAASAFCRGAGVPLLLDFRDEWTMNTSEFVGHHAGESLWEARCLATPDHVFFTTGAMQCEYLRSYPTLRAQSHSVLRNGWDSVDDATHPLAEDPDTTARIAFMGEPGSWSDLDEMLGTLHGALGAFPVLTAQVRLDFVGARHEAAKVSIRQFPIPGVVQLRPGVPRDVAQAQMRRYDALLLLNPPALHRCAPGKLYEYLAARRPILMYGTGGEAGALLDGYPGLVAVAQKDEHELVRALRRIADGAVARRMREEADTVDRFVERHDRRHRSRELISAVRAVLRDGSHD